MAVFSQVLAAGTAAVMLVAAAGCDLSAAEEPETVLVGVVLNLTGPDSRLDTVYRDALELELDRIIEQDLAGGRSLELAVRDNRGDTDIAVRQLGELAADPEVTAVITGTCGECAIAAAAELEQARVPTISLAPVSDVAAPADQRRYLFKVGPDAGDAADRFSEEIARGGATTLGLVATDDPYGREGAQQMRDAASRDQVEVVAEHRLAPDAGESDVAAEVAAIAEWVPPPDPVTGLPDPTADPEQVGPDAVVLWLNPQAVVEVGTGLRDAGYTGPLYVDILAVEDRFLPPDGDALADAQTVFGPVWEADQTVAASLPAIARKVWHDDYLVEHGAIHPGAAWATDALRIITTAVDRADTTDRAAVHAKIESTLFDGISGQIRITADQHSAVNPNSLQVLTAWR